VNRRNFVAGGAALLGLNPTQARAGQLPKHRLEIAPELASLQSRLADAPAPISETERVQRRDKAQRLW
jgi:hypothetical protein